MNIGIYDADLLTYHSVPLNLEVMKLSAYHKLKERDIVSLSPHFNPDAYSKYYVRKDFYDGYFPKNMGDYDNIIYGGLAFSGKYKPLEEAIELYKPDYHIYDNILKRPEYAGQEYWGKNNSFISHFRLSLDGQNIWDKFEKPMIREKKIMTYYSHDYEINNINNSFEVIQDILKDSSGKGGRGSAGFGSKFPINVTNIEDALKWLSIPLSKSTQVVYNGILSTQDFLRLYESVAPAHLAHFVYNVVIPQSFTNEKKNELFMEIYFMAIFLWKRKLKFSLTISQDFFESEKWADYLELLNTILFADASVDKTYATMFSQVARFPSKRECNGRKYRMSKNEARNVFAFIEQRNRPLFEKFYTTYQIEEQGGELIDVSKSKYRNS